MGNKKSKVISTELSEKQIALLRANTNYSEDEIRQWHAGFIRDCPDGRIDKKKFVDIYTRFYPQGKAANYCKYTFDVFDRNDDGTIDFNEFLLSMAATNAGDVDERLSLAFDLYDISDDGYIDQKEVVKVMTAIYDLTGVIDRSGDRDPKKRAAEIVAKADVSGEKKLSKEEFVAACKNDPFIREIMAPEV